MKSINSKFYVAQLFLLLSIFFAAGANAQWSMGKTFGISGKNEYITGMGIDGQNNLYVIGEYSNADPQYDFDGQPLLPLPTVFGSNKGLVFAKYDASNNLEFVKSYRALKDTSEASQITDSRMAVASNGDVVIAGTYRHSIEIEGQTLVATETGFGESNLFIAKFNNTGNLSWLKNVDTYGATCKDIALTAAGDVILGGAYKQAIDFGNGLSNSGSSSHDWGFLCKLAGSDGTAQKLEIFDGGHPTNITMGGSGEMIVIGQFRKNQIDFSNSTTLMLQTPETNSNLKLNNFISKFSAGLAPVWIKQVRGNSEGTAEATWIGNKVKVMLNMRYYLAINNDSIDGKVNAVVNMDPNTGNVSTIVEAGDFLYGMAGNASNTFLFTGRAAGNVFSFGSYNVPMPEEFAFFTLDQTDSVQWVEWVDASFSSIVRADFMYATSNDVIMGGSLAYCDTVKLSPTVFLSTNDNLYTTGWFAKYGLSGSVSVDENVADYKLSFYPNPASEFIIIESLKEDITDAKWQILGIDGRQYSEGQIEKNSFEISISDLPRGMYLLSLQLETVGAETIQFIKK